jgi:hypothetical protein
MTVTSAAAVTAEDAERLQAQIRDLEHERKHLLALIEILQEIAGSLHFVDIMQSITRRLGEAFGLDRCSIFLAERDGKTVRLVASYEDPGIRNYMVDLDRYPELAQAIKTGRTVFIPDVEKDPSLEHVAERPAAPPGQGHHRRPDHVEGCGHRGHLPANLPGRAQFLRRRRGLLPGCGQPHGEVAPERPPFRAAAAAGGRVFVPVAPRH